MNVFEKRMQMELKELKTLLLELQVKQKAMDIKAEYQKLRSSGFRHEDAARYLDREFGVSREELEYTLDPVNFKPKVDPRNEDPQPNQMLY